MNIISITLFCIVSVLISILLKKDLPEFSFLCSLLSCVIIFILCVPEINKIIVEIKQFFNYVRLPVEYLNILLKTVGTYILTQFASDSCKDAGNQALANKIEFAGKIFISINALPIFFEVLRTIHIFLD
ncbi:MAG: stage III sporulation protein AD [Candidatus Improbicoccus devescovinae]|nr:MAG: stage III sporulation protein AD [Candidatus Improbicoccus devescovinae]